MIQGVYFGIRGYKFKEFIKNILKLGNIKISYIDKLISDEYIKEYDKVFTSKQINDKYNYEFYEQLGDAAVNKFIIYYSYRRFPQLKSPDGLKFADKIKSNYGSGQSLAKIAEKYGFWEYITSTNQSRETEKVSLLEDVFEAFFGATEYLIDEFVRYKDEEIYGIGYSCVYKILKVMFDEVEISLKYEDMFDCKTRLNEVFYLHNKKLGKPVWVTKKVEIPDQRPEYDCKIYAHKILISEARNYKKDLAEQEASSKAIIALANLGFKKDAPLIFQKMIDGIIDEKHPKLNKLVKVNSDQEISDVINNKINRGKFIGEPILYYCKNRQSNGINECINYKADLSVEDEFGLSPLDKVLLGQIDIDTVKKCIKAFGKNTKLKISANVYKNYEDIYNLSKYKNRFVFSNY
jgi:dsRNA-specific ribonuclease